MKFLSQIAEHIVNVIHMAEGKKRSGIQFAAVAEEDRSARAGNHDLAQRGFMFVAAADDTVS